LAVAAGVYGASIGQAEKKGQVPADDVVSSLFNLAYLYFNPARHG